MPNPKCYCEDLKCPVCQGNCKEESVTILFRIDMEDLTGTTFCFGCALDVQSSGLYREMTLTEKIQNNM